MDTGFMCATMDKDMRDNCFKAWNKGKESIFIKMEEYMKENGQMIKDKDKELRKMRSKEYFTTVNGLMIRKMDMEKFVCWITQ